MMNLNKIMTKNRFDQYAGLMEYIYRVAKTDPEYAGILLEKLKQNMEKEEIDD